MNKDYSMYFYGIFYIFISALMYSFLPVLGKFAYATGLTPATTLFLRYFLALIVLAIYLGIIAKEKIIIKSWLVLLQGTLITFGGLSFFYSFQHLSAGLATVLLFTYPIIVAILATIIYKEKLTKPLVLSLALALSGIVLISGITKGFEDISAIGIFYALIASVFYALYSLIGQKTVSKASPLTLTATFCLIASIVLAVVQTNEISGIFHLTFEQILIGFLMAIISTIFAISFFLKGVHKIGASNASVISAIEPCLTIIVAFLLLGEVLTSIELIGSLLVLSSMIITASNARTQGESKIKQVN